MNTFLVLHIVTITPCLVIGPFILFRIKGDRFHKILGRTWATLMLISCILSFGVRSEENLTWLHGLAAFTIYQLLKGICNARNHNMNGHRRNMVGSYIRSLVAFIFTLQPTRFIGGQLFKLFGF